MIEIVEVNPGRGSPKFPELIPLIPDASERIRFVGVTVAVQLRRMRVPQEADIVSRMLTEALRELCGDAAARIDVHFVSREAVVFQRDKVVAAIGVDGQAQRLVYRRGYRFLPLFGGTRAA